MKTFLIILCAILSCGWANEHYQKVKIREELQDLQYFFNLTVPPTVTHYPWDELPVDKPSK